MAIMAKKSKNVKGALDVTADGASIDENVCIEESESEPVSKKKKKKSKAGEELDKTVDATAEGTPNPEVNKSSKKEKKKKQKADKDESCLEETDTSIMPASDNLIKSERNTGVVSTPKSEVSKKDGKSIARSCKQRLQVLQ